MNVNAVQCFECIKRNTEDCPMQITTSVLSSDSRAAVVAAKQEHNWCSFGERSQEANPNAFGENLRLLRVQLGLSQGEFGQLIGVTHSSLSSYERGDTSPTLKVATGIAKSTRLSLDWLCGLSVTQQVACHHKEE